MFTINARRLSCTAALLAAVMLVAVGGCQRGQTQVESGLHIELDANRRAQVRIGLPSTGAGGQESGRSRNGAWAPVYVKLKAGKEPVPADAYRLVVETTDSEDSPYRYQTAIPALGANEDYFVISYIRPGTGGSDVRVGLETADGRVVQSAGVVRDPGQVLGPRDQLFLALGSRLPGLRRALVPKEQGDPAVQQDDDPEDRGALRAAYLDTVSSMPDRWFGYDAVDVVILTTGSESYLKRLLEAPEAPSRRKALGEWVRRGGKLIVSVARNHQLASEVLERLTLPEVDKMPLLDCAIGASVKRRRLSDFVHWCSPAQHQRVPLENVEIAELRPGPDVQVLAAERPETGDNNERPVLVQASCGLGRVVLTGIDLDAPPFASWPGQGAFWTRLLGELGPRSETAKVGLDRPELGTELRRRLEDSLGVTPVSFGWVALFILIYIVLIGPLDYLILKKVFKRLEWTWVTFPVVVVAVSLAAYFTAYALKGEDLRVNKVDFLEFDLHTPQAYGQSWFTLYSPRMQNYTVGIEPAWSQAVTMLAVLDDPESAGRNGGQAVFSRPYDYAPDAAGVRSLPVPVWATRTFAASWRGPLDKGKPAIAAEVRHGRGDERHQSPTLSGTINNNLPVDLHDVVLFYRNRSYGVGTLPSESFYRIDNLELGGPRGVDLGNWFTMGNGVPDLLKALLFHRHDRQATGMPNSNFRTLDQQWRLVPGPGAPESYRDEVLLFGRTKPHEGPAETLTADPTMPTRLWLGKLPAAGAARPPLAGLLKQETLVRAFIPVQHPHK